MTTTSADPVAHPDRAGPVALTGASRVALRPLPLGGATIAGGFWGSRQQVNRAVSIPAGERRLREAGNLDDLALAARATGAGPGGAAADPGGFTGPLFMDSDVYKWLEAVAWEQAREASPDLARAQREVTAAVQAAQEQDGYLNSYVQVVTGARYADLPWSHELYCAGHLMQAAVAQARATGETALLGVATRFADHLVATFGRDALDEVDGHPVVEMALVELSRCTGDERYLELARYFVDARGRGLVAAHGPEPTYFSDRVPVREATTVEGHSVRALYLAAGAADLATETGDDELHAALERQWAHMVATKTYLTGGLGSRWEGESFGDPFELPPDRAYCETCAAIGSVQWSWRMLLATGEARYADLVERTLFNAFVPGVSLDGEAFFYVNALQVRTGATGADRRNPVHGRRPWFSTACCPPNVMRTLAQLDTYLATADSGGVQLHQLAPGTVTADVAGGQVGVDVTTAYPHEGRVEMTVTATPDGPWCLSVRVPGWAGGARVELLDAEARTSDGPEPVSPGDYHRVRRTWRVGDRVVLELPMAPRLTVADTGVDAVRGCVAIERGPLVYCLEQVDQPDVDLDDVRLVSGELREQHRPELLGGVHVIELDATVVARDHAPVTPYRGDAAGEPPGTAVTLTAVPYYAWANRGPGAMRVWVPDGRPAS